MTKKDVQRCRRMLETKRAELLAIYRETEGIAVQKVPDSMEELNLELQRNMAVDSLNRRAALLRQVREALERIGWGEYGICQDCQKAISPKRLAALPWAALCLECQEAAESGAGTEVKQAWGSVIPRASANGGRTNSQARL